MATRLAVNRPTAIKTTPASMGAPRVRPRAAFIAAKTGIPIPAASIVIA
jgi:hypothetical protein